MVCAFVQLTSVFPIHSLVCALVQFAPRRGVCAAMPPVLGPYATSCDMFGDVGLVFVFLTGSLTLTGSKLF